MRPTTIAIVGIIGVLAIIMLAAMVNNYNTNTTLTTRGKTATTTTQTTGTTTDYTPGTTGAIASPMTSPVTTKSVTVMLDEQNTSGESGTATLTEENGRTTVKLVLTGAPSTTEQPAHIHMGSCPTPGEVKYPLTNVKNGMSETVIDATLEKLKTQGPLAINVHKSAAESNVYVACGDVMLP